MPPYANRMDNYSKQIDAILKKVSTLSTKHSKLKSENHNLSASNKQLNEELESKNKTIDELKNQLNVLKLAKGVTVEDGEKKEMKKKVNEYIKEIDKCLAMLNAKKLRRNREQKQKEQKGN